MRQGGGGTFSSQPGGHSSTTAATGGGDPELERDFRKAYLDLVKKVYQEQGSNILVS
jgi:hypothetical protein